MIRYIVVTCDANMRRHQVESLQVSDIDCACEKAIEAYGSDDSRFVVAVIESEHGAAVATLLSGFVTS